MPMTAPVAVDQRAAGVAGVDGGVGLDGVDHRVRVGTLRRPAGPAGRVALTIPVVTVPCQPERRADGDHRVPDRQLALRVPELGHRRVRSTSTLTTARSVFGSRPTIVPGARVPSWKITSRLAAAGLGGRRDHVVVGQDVAGRLDHDPGAGVAVVADPDLDGDHRRHRAVRDVGHRPGRALLALHRLGDRRVRLGEVLGSVGRQPADQPTGRTDQHGHQGQRGQRQRRDPAAEQQLAQAEPGALAVRAGLSRGVRVGRRRAEGHPGVRIPPRVVLGGGIPEGLGAVPARGAARGSLQRRRGRVRAAERAGQRGRWRRQVGFRCVGALAALEAPGHPVRASERGGRPGVDQRTLQRARPEPGHGPVPPGVGALRIGAVALGRLLALVGHRPPRADDPLPYSIIAPACSKDPASLRRVPQRR